MMSEPRDDDDVALGIEDEEIIDDEFDTLEEKYGLAEPLLGILTSPSRHQRGGFFFAYFLYQPAPTLC